MNINDKNSKTYLAPEYQPLIPLPEFRRSGRVLICITLFFSTKLRLKRREL